MNKGKNFVGQPIFSQLIKLIDRNDIARIITEHQSDRYYKKYTTWVHLVSMLYATLSKCHALRELTTGLLACEGRLNHLGLSYCPKRSTVSDGNRNRSSEVFRSIYQSLYKRFETVLSDSRVDNEIFKRLYIVDSTTISLFKEILKGNGRNRIDGKSKGGIKAHTVIRADSQLAQFVHFTAAATHDSCLLDHLSLQQGDFICFDKAYIDYLRFEQYSAQGIYFVTRMKDNAVYKSIEELDIPDDTDDGIIKDEIVSITVQHKEGHSTQLAIRRIAYWDNANEKLLVFQTNHMALEAQQIATIYKRRWHIEKLFKKLKQNFPLKYFLGDNQNAIEIQIWVAFIAMLLIHVIKNRVKKRWAFSNMVSFVSFHLMSYIDIIKFLNNPEKCWSEKQPLILIPDLFSSA